MPIAPHKKIKLPLQLGTLVFLLPPHRTYSGYSQERDKPKITFIARMFRISYTDEKLRKTRNVRMHPTYSIFDAFKKKKAPFGRNSERDFTLKYYTYTRLHFTPIVAFFRLIVFPQRPTMASQYWNWNISRHFADVYYIFCGIVFLQIGITGPIGRPVARPAAKECKKGSDTVRRRRASDIIKNADDVICFRAKVRTTFSFIFFRLLFLLESLSRRFSTKRCHFLPSCSVYRYSGSACGATNRQHIRHPCTNDCLCFFLKGIIISIVEHSWALRVRTILFFSKETFENDFFQFLQKYGQNWKKFLMTKLWFLEWISGFQRTFECSRRRKNDCRQKRKLKFRRRATLVHLLQIFQFAYFILRGKGEGRTTKRQKKVYPPNESISELELSKISQTIHHKFFPIFSESWGGTTSPPPQNEDSVFYDIKSCIHRNFFQRFFKIVTFVLVNQLLFVDFDYKANLQLEEVP